MTKDKSNAIFPSEILCKIFEQLPAKSLFACLCVCKLWLHSAGQIYYRRITIDNERQSGDIEKLAQYIVNNHSLAIGSKIKCIQISGQPEIRRRTVHPGDSPAPSSALNLQILLQLCPNLQELAFSFGSIYWKHINGMDSSFFDMVRPRRVYMLGCQRLSEEKYFYNVAYQFRSSLCELEIYCSCDSFIPNNLCSYLQSFPLLHSLTIKRGSRRSMVYFQKLLDVCKQLKYLNFQLDHPFFEHERDRHQPWLEYPSMHELDIYLPSFEPYQVQYLIQRFTNLKKFSLRINQNDERLKTHDLESNKQYFKHDFIHFVSKLDSLSLDFNIKRRSYLEDLIESYYLPLISKAGTDAVVDSTFEICHGHSEEAQIRITKEKEKHAIQYRVVRNFSALDQEQQQVEAAQILPYIPHLHLCGHHLQSLSITIIPRTRHYEAIDIDSVVRLCRNLQRLTIATEFTSIDDLPPDHQHPASHHWVNSPKSAPKPKLFALTIRGMAISSDLVRAIATQYPNLKEFALLSCFSEATDTSDALDNSKLSLFMYDLSNLHLGLLGFDVFWHRRSKDSIVPLVCVVVENQDKVCSYYVAKQKRDAITGDLFQGITSTQYELVVDSAEFPVTVVWFKVKLVDKLVLLADRNQSAAQSFILG